MMLLVISCAATSEKFIPLLPLTIVTCQFLGGHRSGSYDAFLGNTKPPFLRLRSMILEGIHRQFSSVRVQYGIIHIRTFSPPGGEKVRNPKRSRSYEISLDL